MTPPPPPKKSKNWIGDKTEILINILDPGFDHREREREIGSCNGETWNLKPYLKYSKYV